MLSPCTASSMYNIPIMTENDRIAELTKEGWALEDEYQSLKKELNQIAFSFKTNDGRIDDLLSNDAFRNKNVIWIDYPPLKELSEKRDRLEQIRLRMKQINKCLTRKRSGEG